MSRDPGTGSPRGAAGTVASMTGFGSADGRIGPARYRIEARSVNHRFVDLKVRMPRELAACESAVRALVQSRVARGAVELKIERVADGAAGTGAAELPDLQMNTELARLYAEKLRALQIALGFTDTLRTRDIAVFPDVFTRGSPEWRAEEIWGALEPLVADAVANLLEMRRHEGEALRKVLLAGADELLARIDTLRRLRASVTAAYPERIRERIRGVFEAYPLPTPAPREWLESRIAQELALLIDRTDVEEELTRFAGHLEHLRKILREGGGVGRKLDFVLQELNREVNTLGNKAQDYGMSEEVIAAKVKLEQLREQVMNLE